MDLVVCTHISQLRKIALKDQSRERFESSESHHEINSNSKSGESGWKPKQEEILSPAGKRSFKKTEFNSIDSNQLSLNSNHLHSKSTLNQQFTPRRDVNKIKLDQESMN